MLCRAEKNQQETKNNSARYSLPTSLATATPQKGEFFNLSFPHPLSAEGEERVDERSPEASGG